MFVGRGNCEGFTGGGAIPRVRGAGPQDQRVNERGKTPVIPAHDQEVSLDMKAGSSCVVHSHVLHGSEEHRSTDRLRRAFLTSHLEQGAPYRPGQAGDDRKRSEIDP